MFRRSGGVNVKFLNDGISSVWWLRHLCDIWDGSKGFLGCRLGFEDASEADLEEDPESAFKTVFDEDSLNSESDSGFKTGLEEDPQGASKTVSDEGSLQFESDFDSETDFEECPESAINTALNGSSESQIDSESGDPSKFSATSSNLVGISFMITRRTLITASLPPRDTNNTRTESSFPCLGTT